MASEFVYCNWQENPPRGNWDISRRATLEYIRMAETALARLRAKVAEYPTEKEPDFSTVCRMVEGAAEAKRMGEDAECSLRAYMETKKDKQ